MSNGIIIRVPLDQFLDFNQLTPDMLANGEISVHLSIPGQVDFPECMGRYYLPSYLNLIRAMVGVEVGVQRGDYSTHLLEYWPGFLFLVDAWQQQGEHYQDQANVCAEDQEANYRATLKAIEPYNGRYEIIRDWSIEAAKRFEDGQLDFVYLDADHGYEAVLADLEAWLPKLRPGGLMCGHDFLDYDGELGSFRVRTAVTEFAQAHGYQLYVSREWWPSLWYFVK